MRLAWAVALGVAIAAVLVWWLEREQAATPEPGTVSVTAPSPSEAPGRVLYRWRDQAGVVQVTDTPPSGRKYETVDIDALDRRNKFDAQPAGPQP